MSETVNFLSEKSLDFVLQIEVQGSGDLETALIDGLGAKTIDKLLVDVEDKMRSLNRVRMRVELEGGFKGLFKLFLVDVALI